MEIVLTPEELREVFRLEDALPEDYQYHDGELTPVEQVVEQRILVPIAS